MKPQHTLTPEAYKYDFDGACAPHNSVAPAGSYHTFTLGIFQWLPKSGSRKLLTPKYLKRGKSIVRIKGDMAQPEAAYEQARAYCARLNESVAQTHQ